MVLIPFYYHNKEGQIRTPDESFKHITSLKNAGGNELCRSWPEEAQVKILPDNNISPGLFIPSPNNLKIYFAHSTTIRALKTNLFMAGDDFEDLEIIYTCEQCDNRLDLQFWKFCPYCEASFPKKAIDSIYMKLK